MERVFGRKTTLQWVSVLIFIKFFETGEQYVNKSYTFINI
jgi:hypothetical protein